MSKRYRIKWTDSDNKELKRVVKNYNAKISRLEKKDPKLKNILPEKTSVQEMRKLIDTRQDLKRELNALKRFSKRGAEKVVEVPDNDYNLKITKWQKEEMTRRVGVINRRREKRLEEYQDLEMKSRGKPLGYTKSQHSQFIGMGRAEEVATRPMNAFTKKMTNTDLKKKWKAIMVHSQSTYYDKRDEQLMSNVINTILENFNPEDVSEIVTTIRKMDFNEFYSIWQSEGGNMEFAYPPDKELYLAYLEGLKSTWLPNRKEVS